MLVPWMEEGGILWDKRRGEESLCLWFRLESESHGFCRGERSSVKVQAVWGRVSNKARRKPQVLPD